MSKQQSFLSTIKRNVENFEREIDYDRVGELEYRVERLERMLAGSLAADQVVGSQPAKDDSVTKYD